MLNTSKGYHTFSFFQRLSWENYDSLMGNFNGYMQRDRRLHRCPIKDKKNPNKTLGWEYYYKPSRGMRWRMKPIKVSDNLTIHFVQIIVTPKVLTDNSFLAAATQCDIDKIEVLFNEESAKISPILSKFGACSVNRADPCLNLDTEEINLPCSVEQMMKLIKRGNIPRHYKEREKYDESAHRMKAADDSFYLVSGSTNINFYLKPRQLDNRFPECHEKENARHLIRLEVQSKYPMLYSLSKGRQAESRFYEHEDSFSPEEFFERSEIGMKNPTIPIDIILSDKNSDEIIEKYFYKTVRKGNYLTLEGAIWMVKRCNFRRDKEERLINTLELVNECRGISKAKAKLTDTDLRDFKRSLKDLDALLINPVTIPRSWGIPYIPNLLRAYYDSVYERIWVSNEHLFYKHLKEYFSF
ncbi:MAG: hypothetical protein FWC16_01950 [Defluviitaleaceae bacterium]|nr:hypothetical protein [Defluviitaleaceae bacterium]MCL2273662.1 hypothetical protein [Defluviitaleaceae bacterium]